MEPQYKKKTSASPFFDDIICNLRRKKRVAFIIAISFYWAGENTNHQVIQLPAKWRSIFCGLKLRDWYFVASCQGRGGAYRHRTEKQTDG